MIANIQTLTNRWFASQVLAKLSDMYKPGWFTPQRVAAFPINERHSTDCKRDAPRAGFLRILHRTYIPAALGVLATAAARDSTVRAAALSCLYHVCAFLVPAGEADFNDREERRRWEWVILPVVDLAAYARADDAWRTLPVQWLHALAALVGTLAQAHDMPVHPDCSLLNLLLDIWMTRGQEAGPAGGPLEGCAALLLTIAACLAWSHCCTAVARCQTLSLIHI